MELRLACTHMRSPLLASTAERRPIHASLSRGICDVWSFSGFDGSRSPAHHVLGGRDCFHRSLDHTSRPHWRIASRMLEWAWMSAADEEAANVAFRNALEIDGLLQE